MPAADGDTDADVDAAVVAICAFADAEMLPLAMRSVTPLCRFADMLRERVANYASRKARDAAAR